MSLSPKTKKVLKGKAHVLKPIVSIGNKGLTEAVIKEIDVALNDHELIKIRLHSEDREMRRQFLAQICEATTAELVQVIGKLGVIYRKNEDE